MDTLKVDGWKVQPVSGLDIRMNRILALRASSENPHWWVFISFREGRFERPEPLVSFAVVYENHACEWMPPTGPFMMWYRGDEKDGHIFGRILDRPLAWSQMAADRWVDYLVPGRFEVIFSALESFASANEHPYEEDEDEL